LAAGETTARRPSTISLIYLAPVSMFAILVLSSPAVWSRTGVMSLLVLAAVLGIASVGQTWAVLIGGIDLSVPAVIGMANVVLATLYVRGLPFGVICLVLLGLAVAIGVLNGVLSSVLDIHPLVITLGVGSVVTGAVLVATKGNTGGTVPEFITSAVSPVGETFGVPVPASLLLWIAVSALVLYLERRSVLGRNLMALGSNRIAARLALIRPFAVRTCVYVLSAGCGCVAGVLLGGFSGGASADIGNPYLFSTITAVVVGGTSLLGGRGTYGRTISGVLVTTEFTTLLVGRGIGANLQQVLLGLAILVLITIYGRDRHVAQRI
jgi:ribose transport system permease protein